MPGWRAATKDLEDAGRIRSIAIVEEQHPDRARLFMQWKEIPWPVLVDSLDLLGVPYVPITLLIDEQGIIRAINPEVSGPSDVEAAFGPATASSSAQSGAGAPPAGGPAPVSSAPPPALPEEVTSPDRLRPGVGQLGGAVGWRRYGDALFLWGGVPRLSDAIEAYGRAVAMARADGALRFRLGVALRRRYDSPSGRAGDFTRAVEEWQQALDADPNQYIWRRRIQQYGPRLDKPYPFYDWVAEARRDIAARGATPIPLPVEPLGAELAGRATAFERSGDEGPGPDPKGAIARDDGRFVAIETTVVPPHIAPGGAVRVHLVLRPARGTRVHWNNEAADLVLWIDPPPGWLVDHRRLSTPRPHEATSTEPRDLESEVRAPGDSGGAGVTQGPPAAALSGYALYYVCEDVKGTCLYRRQDFHIDLPLIQSH